MAAARFVFYFFHGTGEIEVDHVVACAGHDRRGVGHDFGFAADDLAGDGMIFAIDVDGFSESFAAVAEDDVEKGFGDGVGAAAAASDEAHGAIAVTGQAGLDEGRG